MTTNRRRSEPCLQRGEADVLPVLFGSFPELIFVPESRKVNKCHISDLLYPIQHRIVYRSFCVGVYWEGAGEREYILNCLLGITCHLLQISSVGRPRLKVPG